MQVIHWFPFRKKKIKTFPTWIIDNQQFIKKKKLTAYYSLDKYFNKEITVSWDFDTSNKKKEHISNRGSIITNIDS